MEPRHFFGPTRPPASKTIVRRVDGITDYKRTKVCGSHDVVHTVDDKTCKCKKIMVETGCKVKKI